MFIKVKQLELEGTKPVGSTTAIINTEHVVVVTKLPEARWKEPLVEIRLMTGQPLRCIGKVEEYLKLLGAG